MRVGILGAGQLGRMLAMAGESLGMQFRFLDPARDISARGLGEHICADWVDEGPLADFADGLDLITYEFENVPDLTAAFLAERVALYPPVLALHTAQERLVEKSFFRDLGAAVPAFVPLAAEGAVEQLTRHLDADEVTLPAVIKTRRFGYDGKGQRVVHTRAEAVAAVLEFAGMELIVEGFVPFERELSMLAVRSRDGECRFYPLVENHHRGGILRLSLAPVAVDPSIQEAAEKTARQAMNALGYVGVLAIEFFLAGGELLVNEMAPRVHNSGHWTIEGSVASQFENHMRAVAGMPLGSAESRGFAAMANIIGNHPPQEAIEALAPEWTYHDYGKSPREGRKLGHMTTVQPTEESRAAALENLRRILPELGV